MGSDKKKITVIGLSSLLLVAMVIGVTVSITKTRPGDSSASTNADTIATTQKAVEAFCSSAPYKEECKTTLANVNSTNPKELLEYAFNVTIDTIGLALKNSSVLQQAANDERTKVAFHTCEQVLDRAIGDVRRSLGTIQSFDVTNLNFRDIETWLSASLTFQTNCVDGFNKTQGELGVKMEEITKAAREMSSNGLAVIKDFNAVFTALQIGGLGAAASTSRRLMESDSELPEFVDEHSRKLMSVSAYVRPTPDAVVSKAPNAGEFKTITEAINSIPNRPDNSTFVIYIKEGVYDEQVTVNKTFDHVVIMGDGPTKTIITGNKSYVDAFDTYTSPSFIVDGEDFLMRDIAIENTAGNEGHQAVALRVTADKSIFYNVRIEGHQSTLYTQTYRQFYRNCNITGTVDFIFGDALALFQQCRFIVRSPSQDQDTVITGQERNDANGIGGYVIQESDIEADPAYFSARDNLGSLAYLGRPKKLFSRTIIMRSNINGFIDPAGWTPLMGDFGTDTCTFGEYNNRGAGAYMVDRVKWKGIRKINSEDAEKYTGRVIYKGDEWLTSSEVPYEPGMF